MAVNSSVIFIVHYIVSKNNRLNMKTFLVLILFAGVITGFLFYFSGGIDMLQWKDERRKKDIGSMQNILEQFKRDNGVYPLSTGKDEKLPYRIRGFKVDHAVVDWGEEFLPYLAKLPKDPQNDKRYVYFASPNGQAYWLYASLEGEGDKDMCNTGKACISISGNSIDPLACGSVCNYGVSSRNVSP